MQKRESRIKNQEFKESGEKEGIEGQNVLVCVMRDGNEYGERGCEEGGKKGRKCLVFRTRGDCYSQSTVQYFGFFDADACMR